MCSLELRFSFPLRLTLAAGLSCWLLTGCGPERGNYERFAADPTGPPPSVSRSVLDVLNRNPLPVDAGQDPVRTALLEDILQLGPWPPATAEDRRILDSAWNRFTAFEGTQVALGGIDSALLRSGVLDQTAASLRDAFGRWRVHFPAEPVPEIDFAYTGFNFSVYPTDDLLLIGSEFFIGGDHPAVRGLPTHIYPRYMQERMVPAHMTGDALRGWLLVHFQEGHFDRDGRLAEELLYWGKVLYVARCLAPDLSVYDLLDWTEAEWQWAEDHERQIWSELRKEDILYTRRRMDIQRWVADAPFTKAGDVPQDSPDRLGWYMGLRWVEDHMARQTELDLPGLMSRTDVLPFLQTYRPGS
jgi:hypothetical protein